MTEDQLQLMATILNEIINKHVRIFATYSRLGEYFCMCGSCGAIAEVKHPDIIYAHTETCIITLNKKLQASLKQKEGEQ